MILSFIGYVIGVLSASLLVSYLYISLTDYGRLWIPINKWTLATLNGSAAMRSLTNSVFRNNTSFKDVKKLFGEELYLDIADTIPKYETMVIFMNTISYEESSVRIDILVECMKEIDRLLRENSNDTQTIISIMHQMKQKLDIFAEKENCNND